MNYDGVARAMMSYEYNMLIFKGIQFYFNNLFSIKQYKKRFILVKNGTLFIFTEGFV